jgi:hypothetical protein
VIPIGWWAGRADVVLGTNQARGLETGERLEFGSSAVVSR